LYTNDITSYYLFPILNIILISTDILILSFVGQFDTPPSYLIVL